MSELLPRLYAAHPLRDFSGWRLGLLFGYPHLNRCYSGRCMRTRREFATSSTPDLRSLSSRGANWYVFRPVA